jgi:carboxypeptidase Taq
VSALQELFNYNKTTLLLQSVAGRTGWDQETMMPKKSAAMRSQEMGALEEVIHARKQNKKIGDWIDKADPLSEEDKRKVELIKREFERSNLIPLKLATQLAETSSEAQVVWQEARNNNNFSQFAPALKKIVDLKREEASLLSKTNDLYDGLLNDYEYGMTRTKISSIFEKMKPRLMQLRQKLAGSEINIPGITGDFDAEKQLKLSHVIANVFEYDFERGRIDTVTHPFCSGSGDDVRVTTRTDINDPFNCIYGTIHEVGHACYEQNVAPAYKLTALGSGVSLGIHESQSRIFENQLGRSRPFTNWLFEKMKEEFRGFDVKNEEIFYRIVNKVSPGFIRTEADEVHYNLHIMLRFELETEIISKKPRC